MPRRRLDLHQPDAAFAAMSVEAAQHGDLEEAERLARIADRYGRLKLKLEPGELQRLSRIRALERRVEILELRLEPLLQMFEAEFADRPAAAGDAPCAGA